MIGFQLFTFFTLLFLLIGYLCGKLFTFYGALMFGLVTALIFVLVVFRVVGFACSTSCDGMVHGLLKLGIASFALFYIGAVIGHQLQDLK